MYPYAEAPIRSSEPEYRPATSGAEVLDVILGRTNSDSLGRFYDNLMTDTSMAVLFERLADDYYTERALMDFLGRNWDQVPDSVKAIFQELADAAATQ